MNAPPSTDLDDATALRQQLVDQLLRDGSITSPSVEAAFRSVPRHLFVPEVTLDLAYANQVVPTKWIDDQSVSAASQPGIVARMLEYLAVQPGHRVLEIGAGTGYNAALLAYLVGDTGSVLTLDIDEDLVAGARAHLAAAGIDRVQVVCADGRGGYPAGAPYDRIILTVAAPALGVAWQTQLAPGGRLVLPLLIAGGVQRIVAFELSGDHLASVSTGACSFMLLRDAATLPEGHIALDPEGDLVYWSYARQPDAAAQAHRLLLTEGELRPTGLRLTLRELVHGLGPWLDMHEPCFCTITARNDAAERGLVPSLMWGLLGPRRRWCTSGAWLGADELCMLACPVNRSPTFDAAPFDLLLRTHGTGATRTHHLLDHIADWEQAGRPTLEDATLRAYPRAVGYRPAAHETLVERGEMTLVIAWQRACAPA